MARRRRLRQPRRGQLHLGQRSRRRHIAQPLDGPGPERQLHRGQFLRDQHLAPDPDFAFAGKDFIDGQTTGIVIATLSDITINIADNVVANDANGIWIGEVFGAKVTVTGTATNIFVNEAAPVVVVTH